MPFIIAHESDCILVIEGPTTEARAWSAPGGMMPPSDTCLEPLHLRRNAHRHGHIPTPTATSATGAKYRATDRQGHPGPHAERGAHRTTDGLRSRSA